jgi:hypothetical protein
MDFFSLRGLPAYYTFIDLRPLKGHPSKISISADALIYLRIFRRYHTYYGRMI